MKFMGYLWDIYRIRMISSKFMDQMGYFLVLLIPRIRSQQKKNPCPSTSSTVPLLNLPTAITQKGQAVAMTKHCMPSDGTLWISTFSKCDAQVC